MKIYLMHFVPNIRSILCRFFGTVSLKDFDRLSKKITHLEHKMERMDAHLRRIQRRQMLQEVSDDKSVKAVSKQEESPSSPKKNKRSIKSKQRVPRSSVPSARTSAKVTRLKPSPARVLKPAVAKRPQVPAVMLLGTDSEVRASVRDYFGNDVPLLELNSIAEIPETIDAKSVSAAFFDRAWLAEPKARQALLRLGRRLQPRPMVGIASYLTLSVARSVPEPAEFAAILTKPLDPQALASVLASPDDGREAIS